jgi:hypothetical protein
VNTITNLNPKIKRARSAPRIRMHLNLIKTMTKLVLKPF